MKRICLVVVGLYINLLSAHSQATDSAAYKSRKLSLDEVNFVSSYYNQDGNNSAITGGVGTEKLNDFSNGFELKFLKYDKKGRKDNLDINLGIDYYTSASSDNIDPYSISSASREDLRIYPSVTYTINDAKKRRALSGNISYSHESDYQSYGMAAGYTKNSKDNNTVFTAKAQAYLDRVEIILPIELRTLSSGGITGAPNQHDYPWKHRNSFITSFSYSKILNQRLQVMLLLDLAYQQGFLGLPFHRIYFKDFTLTTEKLPTSRLKLPAGMKANYFLGDKIILRSAYRFFIDSWGLKAHTAELETVVKITPFFSVSPFYRYNTQTGIDYFAGYKQHSGGEKYYSSNYDLAAFESHFFGTGIRFAPPAGLLGHKHWNMIELRYGRYRRSNGLYANIFSLNFKYK